MGFLAIYAALRITPFQRLLLLQVICVSLLALFFFFQRKEAWRALASWVRSAAGSIFLFSTLGSGAIAGLKWIADERIGLSLLALGMAANLFCGYMGQTQGFASLHVALALIALAIFPQSMLALLAGSIASTAGILMAYRSRHKTYAKQELEVRSFLTHMAAWQSVAKPRKSRPTPTGLNCSSTPATRPSENALVDRKFRKPALQRKTQSPGI